MNKNIKYAVPALLALVAGMSSCSNEDMVGDNSNGKAVNIRIKVSKPGLTDETRTILSEDGEGNLDCAWTEGDKILVTFVDGTLRYGYMTLKSGAGEKDGVFEGSLKGLTEGTHNYSYHYLGTENNGLSPIPENGITFDYSNQDGSLASLTKYDVLSGFDMQTSVIDGEAFAENISLARNLAFAHFELKFEDEAVVRNNEAITIACIEEETINAERTYDFTNGSKVNGSSETVITVEGKDGNDFYIALLAGNNFTPQFSVTIDGVLYKGSLGKRAWKESEFVRLSANAGVPVQMTAVEEEPEVDLTKNPLWKWADTNLERVSDTEYYKGKFASSYTKNGHYYQFGRNVGFVDYNEASDCAFIYSSAQEVSLGKGDGTIYNNPDSYYTASNLQNGERKIGFMIPCYDNAKDWWPTNGGISNTWDERAKASGYTPSDLYVINGEKWKVPSISDFQEILPEGNLITEAFNEMKDVKTINNIPVAFRWKKVKEGGSYYLQIKAKVIDNASQAKDINWDSTSDKAIETRYFKAAGFIYPQYFHKGVYYKVNNWTGDIDYVWEEENHKGYQYAGVMYAAQATPFGVLSSQMTTLWAGANDDGIDVKMWVNSSDKLDLYCGRYWTSDAERKVLSFIFDDDSKIGANQFGLVSSNASAYSVRLIRAE